jgi:uncharacterized YigZ family protein
MSDTLASPATHASVVRHSRFVAQAAPASSIDAALAFVAANRVPDATHNCWAYRVGGDYRSSDDGEPAGTSGRPILAAIDSQGFDQVVVLVTRWFGGTKLGAGGLARAYGGAAAECLRTATRRPLVRMCELQLHAGFDDIGVVHALIQAHGATPLESAFDSDGLQLRLALPSAELPALADRLRDATRDRVRVRASDARDVR